MSDKLRIVIGSDDAGVRYEDLFDGLLRARFAHDAGAVREVLDEIPSGAGATR